MKTSSQDGKHGNITRHSFGCYDNFFDRGLHLGSFRMSKHQKAHSCRMDCFSRAVRVSFRQRMYKPATSLALVCSTINYDNFNYSITHNFKIMTTDKKGVKHNPRTPIKNTNAWINQKKVFNPMIDDKPPFNDKATIKEVSQSFTKAAMVYKSLHV